MDLIRGVALIISGETTRYGMSEVVRERKREAGIRKTIAMFPFTMQGALESTETEKAETDGEDEKRDGEEC